jgi:hypothetical protein
MSRAARAPWISSRAHPVLALLAVLTLSTLPASFARGQGLIQYFIVSVAPEFPTSGFPADWQRTNTLVVMTVTSNFGNTTADIGARFYRGGALVGTTPLLPRSFPDGGGIFHTPQILDWRTTQFTGDVGQSVNASGHLPDGAYQVCIDLRNIRNQQGQSMPDTSFCTQFLSIFPKPPVLLFPRNSSTVSTTQPVFQWTPVVSEIGRVLTYQLRVVEMLPKQTSLQAIEANVPVYEQFFTGVNAFPYPASAPHLLEGRKYAWRVQVFYPVSQFSRGGGLSVGPRAGGGSAATGGVLVPIGENEGRSKVFTFDWTGDPKKAIDALTGESDTTDVSSSWLGSIDVPDSRLSSARIEESPRSTQQAGPAGAASDENFADRLARVMASLWKKGPGAASAAARSGGRYSGVAASGDERAGTTGHTRREVGDERIAQGPTGSVGATGPEGVSPSPPESGASPDSATADAAHADATPTESAPVTTAAPSLEPAGVGPDWARLHGTASLYGESYSRDGSGAATRPDQTGRVVTGLSVGVVKDQMRIPVSALISNDQVAFRQNINHVAVAPKWNWAGITAGNFSPQFSPFTIQDATVLGGGFDLAPNKWKLGFLSGRSRKAIAPTTEAFVTPQFERNMTAGRIGFGDALANNAEFAVMHATDDESSIAGAESTLTLTPQGNTVYSLKLQGVMPKRHLRAQVETAFSKWDRDVRADAPSTDGTALGIQLFHETSMARFGVKTEFLNGGFTTLGNSGMTGDHVDLGLTAALNLMQGKLSVGGNVGARNEAAITALAAETRRRNWGVNGSWQPSSHFGLDAQTGVFDNESDDADSLFGGSSNTSRFYSVMPRASWTMRGVQNTFSSSASVQDSKQGGGPGTFLNTSSTSLLASWSAVISAPWTVTLSGNYTKTDYDVAVLETSAFGPGFTWSAFRGKLVTTALVQWTNSRTGNQGTDKDLAPRGEMRWEFMPHQAVVLRGNYRRFQYATPGTPEFNERQATLEYQTNL